MMDDEYTRTIIALDIRAEGNSAARQKLQAIIRSLQRPTARAFAEYLASESSNTMILGPDGEPMARGIPMNMQRVNNTGAHLMRGLYFIETGRPIPDSAKFKVASKAGLTTVDPDMRTIARVFSVFPDRRDGSTGEAFSYAAAFGGGMSVWLMLLYDYFFWVGSVDEREISESEPPAPESRR